MRFAKKLLLLLLAGTLVMVPVVAMASWWSFGAALLTRLGAAAVSLGPVGAVAGAVAGVTQIVIVIVDYIQTLAPQRPPPPRPSYAAPPEPSPYQGGAAMLELNYPAIPFSGNDAAALVASANVAISSFNFYLADFRAGIPPAQLSADLSSFGTNLNSVANEFDRLGLPLFSQADIDGVTALPAFEVAYLQSAGLSPVEIQNFNTYFASVPVNLAVTSVSIGEVVRSQAATLIVPEPGTLALLSAALAGLTVARRPGRFQAGRALRTIGERCCRSQKSAAPQKRRGSNPP